MEHLQPPDTTRDVDLLLLVADPSIAGLRSAARIEEAGGGLNVNVRTLDCLNRASGRPDRSSAPKNRRVAARSLGVVPDDQR